MSFDNDGYLIIHDVLTKEEVQEYRDELDNYLDNNRSFRAEESKILPGWAGNTPGLSDSLNNLHKDPRVLEEVSKIYKGQEFRYVNHSDLHQNKRTTWHRDIHDLERGGCNLGVWTEECFIIKASFLLQDHIDNKFGLLVQPGTHLGNFTSQAVHLNNVSTDLIIFDQRILHSGQYDRPLYHNVYGRNRYLLTFGYGLNNAYSDFHDKGATLRQNRQREEMR